nr:3'(2'),5'-bisphosphate nucleotidase CysQ [Caulobacter sp. 17J65-9]
MAEIAEEAAKIIMPFWRADVTVERKADESPVTEADRQAEAHILGRLAELFPDICVISEEAACDAGVPKAAHARFFLVDPLDGTRGFVRGGESFTVNIALIEDGAPVAGAVAAPASGQVWYTTSAGAMRRRVGETAAQPVRVRVKPDAGLALVSHTLSDDEATRLAARHGCANWQGLDSSVKFCLIAEGRADVYPRPGPTMEWDTAAADAVLRAAGGRVLTEDGKPLTYGKADRGFENPGFLAIGG